MNSSNMDLDKLLLFSTKQKHENTDYFYEL